MANIKLGVSLFSLTGEYATGRLSLEGCIRACKEMGAEGIELVGTQMLETYPYVSDKVAGEFTAMCRAYGIQPVCYGANADRGLLHDRDLTEDELLQMAINDLKTAWRMGFKVVRVQYMLGIDGMRRLVPYAKDYGLKVGVEIHNPETPSSKLTTDFIEMFKAEGSGCLGIVMDFGAFATKPNKPHWDDALAAGAPLELLQMAEQLRRGGTPMDEAMAKLAQAGAPPSVMTAASGMYGFVTFYDKPDLEGFARIMPYVIHCHGKFHYMGEDYKEASIPYEEVLPVLQASDFDGYIMSECENQGAGAIVMTERHLEMERRILAGGR